MEKEFVKYNQALALRELGFDEPCLGYYVGKDKEVYVSNKDVIAPFNPNLDSKVMFRAPTYSQAFRWFREKYELDYYHKKDWTDGVFYGYEVIIECVDGFIDVGTFNTYEEAESACLDKLIEICKNKQK